MQEQPSVSTPVNEIRFDVLIKKACKIESGSANSIKNKVAKITKAQVKEIAEIKLPDLNAYSVDEAIKSIEGTALNMGIEIKD